MTFEPTGDMDLVREIMTHPKVWPYITDDGAPPVAEFRPVEHPAYLYLLCLDGESLLGLWLFVQQNTVTLEVHTCLLPGHGFHRAREAAGQAAEWIWVHTRCQRIFTNVPERNRIALRFAEAAGMVEFGRNSQSWLKGGRLWDQLLFGMSRPGETECRQQ